MRSSDELIGGKGGCLCLESVCIFDRYHASGIASGNADPLLILW